MNLSSRAQVYRTRKPRPSIYRPHILVDHRVGPDGQRATCIQSPDHYRTTVIDWGRAIPGETVTSWPFPKLHWDGDGFTFAVLGAGRVVVTPYPAPKEH